MRIPHRYAISIAYELGVVVQGCSFCYNTNRTIPDLFLYTFGSAIAFVAFWGKGTEFGTWLLASAKALFQKGFSTYCYRHSENRLLHIGPSNTVLTRYCYTWSLRILVSNFDDTTRFHCQVKVRRPVFQFLPFVLNDSQGITTYLWAAAMD